MSFTPKRIFIADDNNEFRKDVIENLMKAGHQVVIEANNGNKALSLIDEAVAQRIDVAVLDCNMPDREDGVRVAKAFNLEIPTLIIASISSHWSGVWEDPNFERDNPYHQYLDSYDKNGRQKYRGPDISLNDTDWNLERFAQLIGATKFSLKNEKELQSLPGFLEWIQGLPGAKGERK